MVLLKSCCMILYNTLLNVLLFNFDFFFSHKGYTRTLYPEWRINLLLQVMSVPLETVFERMTSQMVVYWNNAGFALYNDELTLYPFVIPTLSPEYLYFYFHLYYCFYISKILLFFKFQNYCSCSIFSMSFFFKSIMSFGVYPNTSSCLWFSFDRRTWFSSTVGPPRYHGIMW